MIIQTLIASAGVIGFGAIFGLSRNKLYIVGIFGFLAWMIYMVLKKFFQSESIAMFVITILIVLIAKLIGKKLKCPAVIIATPVLIPFIPGATLYLVMNDFVGNKDTLMVNLELLWNQVGAIVAGNLVAEVLYKDRN